MFTIERKGNSLVLTIPCDGDTLANGKVSGSGKNWVFGTGKAQSGNLTVQFSAYGPLALAPKQAATA